MIGNIFGIASFVIGVIALIVSIVLYVRRKKYPGQIGFYLLDAVKLTNPLFDKSKNIKLTYDDRELEHGVSYLRALVCNVGEDDISLNANSAEDGINIKLPESNKWLDVQLQEKSESLQVSITKDENDGSILHVDGGLFKRDEIFTFEAYIEGEFAKNDGGNICVDHRLPNTASIQTEGMFHVQKKQKRRYFYGTYAFLSVIAFFALGMGMYAMLNDNPINFVERGSENYENVYSAHVYTQDSIIVTRFEGLVWPWNDNKYSVSDFNEKFEISTYTSSVQYWMVMSVLILYGTVILLFVIGLIYLDIKDKAKKNAEKLYLQLVDKEEKQ